MWNDVDRLKLTKATQFSLFPIDSEYESVMPQTQLTEFGVITKLFLATPFNFSKNEDDAKLSYEVASTKEDSVLTHSSESLTCCRSCIVYDKATKLSELHCI